MPFFNEPLARKLPRNKVSFSYLLGNSHPHVFGGTELGCFPWWETHQTSVPYEGAYTKQQELTKRHSTDVTLRVEIH